MVGEKMHSLFGTMSILKALAIRMKKLPVILLLYTTTAGYTTNTYGFVNTTMPPEKVKTKVAFWVIAGQSNTGWSTYTEMNKDSIAKYHVQQNYGAIWNPAFGAFGATWGPLYGGENTACENYVTVNGIGFETSFSHYMHAADPASPRWFFKFGKGNTSLGGAGGLQTWSPSGLIYKQFAEFLDSALAKAGRSGVILDFKGILWMQGEGDAGNPTDAANYYGNLTAFFSAASNMINTKLTTYGHIYHASYKKLIGRISNSTSWPYRVPVRKAQADFCANPLNHAVLVDTDDIPVAADNLHYTSEGEMKLGYKFFKAQQ